MRGLCSTLIAATILLVGSPSAAAAPSTAISPALNVVGQSAGEEFGSSIDCNAPSELTTHRSLIAIGAPQAVTSQTLGASGRVYIVDPTAPSNARVVQTLQSPSPQTNGEFGKALAFVPDFNGDGFSDLAVAQPNSSAGAIFFFQSALSNNGDTVTFTFCGTTASGPYFGEVLSPLRASGVVGASLLIGSPRASPPSTRGVSITSSGISCSVVEHPEFSVEGSAASRFGAGVSFIANHDSSLDGLPDILIGAPREGGAQNISGSVYVAASDALTQPTPTPSLTDTSATPDPLLLTAPAAVTRVALGGETDLLGSSLAGSENSLIFAAGAPGANNGRGRVSLYSSSGGQLCAFSPSLSESSVAFGQTIADVGAIFSALTSGADLNIAAYHSEQSTGGSVALFGMNTTTSACTQRFTTLNNCQMQTTQRQGASLAGGARCSLFTQGALRPFVVVGSPGFNNEQGRVDLYVEGVGIHGAPVECPDSSQAAPIPTSAPTTSPTPIYTTRPRDSSPDPTPTPTPTVSPRAAARIDVFPGYDDLPEPKVETVSNSKVEISLPPVSGALEDRSYSKAFKKLLKSGFSKTQATKALANLFVEYIVTIESTSQEATVLRKKSFIHSAKSAGKRRIRSRKNRLSARLLPSTSYSISYVVELSVRKPKRVVIGATKQSAPTRFRLP